MMRLWRHILMCVFVGFAFGMYGQSNAADTTQCLKLKEAGNQCVVANQYAEALKFYTQAMQQAEQSGNRMVYVECVSNVGMVYAAFRDYDRAIFYFDKANRQALSDGYERMVPITAINLMAAYCAKGEPQRAERFLSMLEQHPVQSAEQQDYYLTFNRGLIASGKKQYQRAVAHLRRSVALAGKECSPSVWYELGNAFSGWGKADSALLCYRKAVEIAQRSNNYEETSQAYKALSEIYKQCNLPDSAIKYQTQYINLQDSLFNINKFNLAKAQLFDYENTLIDRHIHSLHGWIWLLVGIVIVVVAILVVIFQLYRQLQAAQRLLVRKNQELIAQNERSKQLRADYLSTMREAATQLTEPETNTTAQEPEGDLGESNELPLSQEQRALLAEQITQVMDNADAIIDPDFNLNRLSKLVNSNTKYVSVIINDTFQKNFKTLLNESRIREVCRRLSDDDHYGQLTIAAIANGVGYNSMNNFITAFKRITGMTPSKYRQLALKQGKGE